MKRKKDIAALLSRDVHTLPKRQEHILVAGQRRRIAGAPGNLRRKFTRIGQHQRRLRQAIRNCADVPPAMAGIDHNKDVIGLRKRAAVRLRRKAGRPSGRRLKRHWILRGELNDETCRRRSLSRLGKRAGNRGGRAQVDHHPPAALLVQTEPQSADQIGVPARTRRRDAPVKRFEIDDDAVRRGQRENPKPDPVAQPDFNPVAPGVGNASGQRNRLVRSGGESGRRQNNKRRQYFKNWIHQPRSIRLASAASCARLWREQYHSARAPEKSLWTFFRRATNVRLVGEASRSSAERR